MNSLVKRLLADAHEWTVPFLISPKTAALELEAAAEIIRLRKKLAEREKRHD